MCLSLFSVTMWLHSNMIASYYLFKWAKSLYSVSLCLSLSLFFSPSLFLFCLFWNTLSFSHLEKVFTWKFLIAPTSIKIAASYTGVILIIPFCILYPILYYGNSKNWFVYLLIKINDFVLLIRSKNKKELNFVKCI